MTPLDPGILSDILANPDRDDLRGLAADWWDDHGETERAEFVRVQCALAAPILVAKAELLAETRPGEAAARAEERERPRREALSRRERELLHGNGGELVLPRLGWLWSDGSFFQKHCLRRRSYDFRRGFVHAITCTAAAWLEHADAILAAQPIEEVTLTTWPSLDELTTQDLLAPGNWSSGYSIGRGRWRWETLGRPAIEPTWQAVCHLILSAEWPRVKTWHLPTVATPDGGFVGPPMPGAPGMAEGLLQGEVTLQAHKQAVLVHVPNELLADNLPLVLGPTSIFLNDAFLGVSAEPPVATVDSTRAARRQRKKRRRDLRARAKLI